MNILKRTLAPLTDAAWQEIDEEARLVLEANLAARRFVDVIGPLGWEASAVNLGRLEDVDTEGEVRWGTRKVQPLVEFRVPFTVSRWELDNLDRGAPEVDLDPVRKAAWTAARFEERAIYHGLPEARAQGLLGSAELAPLALPNDVEQLPEQIATGLMRLADAGVDGPYLLVLGDQEFRAVAGTAGGYPLRESLIGLVGHAPVYSPGLEGALLVSTRGGDFRLTLGVDLSIGFDHAEGDDVHLYLTESFAFSVLGPEAHVVLTRAPSAKT